MKNSEAAVNVLGLTNRVRVIDPPLFQSYQGHHGPDPFTIKSACSCFLIQVVQSRQETRLSRWHQCAHSERHPTPRTPHVRPISDLHRPSHEIPTNTPACPATDSWHIYMSPMHARNVSILFMRGHATREISMSTSSCVNDVG